MTYPPGSPGYPPAQQPTTQFAAPTQQFSKAPESGPAAAEGPSKLPVYLMAAVAALGLAAYLSNFGPIFTVSNADFPQLGTVTGSSLGIGLAVVASLLSGLLAGVSLLPKQKNFIAVSAAIAVVGFLMVIAELINKPEGFSIGWALYALLAFTILQAGVAVAALLFDAGIITSPAPRPKYEQQYGQYGGPGQYYGQPQGQPQHRGGQHHQGPQQQRPGYPSQYSGGYPGAGPSTGGYSGSQQSGPPTPPTGFPTYGQPPSGSAPTSQVPAQPQSSSSSQSGQSPS
jgi:hypothetical protein